MAGIILLEDGSEKKPGIVLESFTQESRQPGWIVLDVLFGSGTRLPQSGTELAVRSGKKIFRARITGAELAAENGSFVRMKISALPI